MNIVFRVDSSSIIGTGHVMRCLTLANKLKEQAKILFICRKLEGSINAVIEKSGFKVYQLDYESTPTPKIEELNPAWSKDAELTLEYLNEPVDLLIVDHYALDYQWEEVVSTKAKKIFVIDDIANRKHFCNYLLDQNYYQNLESRYSNLVPSSCKKLLGPSYSLLRPEFAAAHLKIRRNFFKKPSKLCIFYGGADHTGETLKALEALERFEYLSYEVDLIVGVSNPNKENILLKAKHLSIKSRTSVENMSDAFSNADLALGAGGTTTWERCCLGLPSIVTSIAENQININKALDSCGAIHYLGISNHVTSVDVYKALKHYNNNPQQLRSLSEKSYKLVDGYGSQRVLEELE